jgi:soluble lytic murein transglycosylase-like protein
MKSKLFIYILVLMIFIISIVKAEDTTNNFIYDNANIISDMQSLNNDIQQIYDKNSGAKIIIYTYSDDTEAKAKYLNNFDEFNFQDNSISNMNILIAYKPNGNLDLFFPKQCGLNKANIQDIITEDNSGFIKELNNGNYNTGFAFLISELGDEINTETIINKMVCQASDALAQRGTELLNQQNKQSLFDSYGILEISDSDLANINKYNSIIIKANAKYPVVGVNLIKGLIMTESSGDKNAESSKNALGLMQLDPCTAKQYKLIPYVVCETCSSQPCTACTKYCDTNSYPTSDPKYKSSIINPTNNVMIGTKLLDDLLEKCADKDFMLALTRRYQKVLKKLGAPVNEEITDTDIISCALASYNAGQGRIGKAAAMSDSLSFDDYRLNIPLESRNHVKKVIGYYNYLEQNSPA